MSGPKIVCAGGCGKEMPFGQPFCKKCAAETKEWRRTYDGPAVLSDEAEQRLVHQIEMTLNDEDAV